MFLQFVCVVFQAVCPKYPDRPQRVIAQGCPTSTHTMATFVNTCREPHLYIRVLKGGKGGGLLNETVTSLFTNDIFFYFLVLNASNVSELCVSSSVCVQGGSDMTGTNRDLFTHK